MNKSKKGQLELGIMMSVFIAVIVGVMLFQAAAQNVGEATNTNALANLSVGAVAVNDTAQFFTDYISFSDVVVWNATGNVEVNSGNYTITNNVVNNGQETVSITPTVSATPAQGYLVGIWTIDATAQPVGYIADSGGRTMAELIILFFAIAIAMVALWPVFGGKMKELMGM